MAVVSRSVAWKTCTTQQRQLQLQAATQPLQLCTSGQAMVIVANARGQGLDVGFHVRCCPEAGLSTQPYMGRLSVAMGAASIPGGRRVFARVCEADARALRRLVHGGYPVLFDVGQAELFDGGAIGPGPLLPLVAFPSPPQSALELLGFPECMPMPGLVRLGALVGSHGSAAHGRWSGGRPRERTLGDQPRYVGGSGKGHYPVLFLPSLPFVALVMRQLACRRAPVAV